MNSFSSCTLVFATWVGSTGAATLFREDNSATQEVFLETNTQGFNIVNYPAAGRNCYSPAADLGYQGVLTLGQVYARCAARPGCKGFVSGDGVVKDWWLLSTIQDTGVTTNPNRLCYTTLPIVSYPTPGRNCYSPSADLGYQGVIPIEQVYARCAANPACNGFVSGDGVAKDFWLLSSVTDTGATNNPNRLCFATLPAQAKVVNFPVAGRNCYSPAADLGYQGVLTLAQVYARCAARPGCKGFVSGDGVAKDWWLLSAIRDTGATTNPNRLCYSALPIVNYPAPGRNCYSPGADLGYQGVIPIDEVYGRCAANPACKGFVSGDGVAKDFWLLSSVTDTGATTNPNRLCYSLPFSG